MFIVNKTKLPLKDVFNIILKIIEKGDEGETFYYGKVDCYFIGDNCGNKYKIEVKYLKRYVKWVIKELKK